MIAIFKREIRNYLKRPLFWVGVLLVIYGVFNATSPYLTTHYLEPVSYTHLTLPTIA